MVVLLALADAVAKRPPPAPVPAPPVAAPVAPAPPSPPPPPVLLTAPENLPCGWAPGTSFTWKVETNEDRTSPGAVAIVTKTSSEQEVRVVESLADRVRLEAPSSTGVSATVTGDPLLRQVLQALAAESEAVPLTVTFDWVPSTSRIHLVDEKGVVRAMESLRSRALQRVAGTDPVEPGGMIDSLAPKADAMTRSWIETIAGTLHTVCGEVGPEQTFTDVRSDPVFALPSPVEGKIVSWRHPDGVVELVEVSTTRVDLTQMLAGSGVEHALVVLSLSDTWRIYPDDGWPESLVSTVEGDILDQRLRRRTTWTRLDDR